MNYGAKKTSERLGAAGDRLHADPGPAPGALTPDMNQDQLQTWEGEGGSIPAPDHAVRPPVSRVLLPRRPAS
jgi:hypothetical protein